MILKAHEIEEENKDNYKAIVEGRNNILVSFVNKFFDYAESIKDKGSESTKQRLELLLKAKGNIQTFLNNGRISIDVDYSYYKVLLGMTKFYVSKVASKVFAPITSSLFSFIESSVKNNLDAIEYISYLIETLGNEEEIDIEEILPLSKKMKEMFEYGTY